MPNIKLTQTVQKGGCAAKIAAVELRKILGEVQFPPTHSELLVDGRYFDDAAIYQVSPEIAMVQTIDFFTPIVDTPYLFGRIAACNALSDVYAMGGVPKTAMGVLAFPLAQFEGSVITQVMQGASDLLKEAGCTLVGGHSIDDDTLKFGLSVTGFVNPKRVWTNQGAKVGDVLILTKRLGTGTLTAALKRELVTEDEISDALLSMGQLNSAIECMTDSDASYIHAATDITGFGLSGHSLQMAKASGVSFEFLAETLPALPRAQEFIEAQVLTKAHRTNREYTQEHLSDAGLAPWQKLLIHDPQTSGGLLLSVDPLVANSLLTKLKERFVHSTVVGSVQPKSGTLVSFV